MSAIRCTKCGQRFEADDEQIGKGLRCPKCLSADFLEVFLIGNVKTQPTSNAPQANPEHLKNAHPRDIVCNRAGIELWDFVTQWDQKHNLTLIERVAMFHRIAQMDCSMNADTSKLGDILASIREDIERLGREERAKS